MGGEKKPLGMSELGCADGCGRHGCKGVAGNGWGEEAAGDERAWLRGRLRTANRWGEEAAGDQRSASLPADGGGKGVAGNRWGEEAAGDERAWLRGRRGCKGLLKFEKYSLPKFLSEIKFLSETLFFDIQSSFNLNRILWQWHSLPLTLLWQWHSLPLTLLWQWDSLPLTLGDILWQISLTFSSFIPWRECQRKRMSEKFPLERERQRMSAEEKCRHSTVDILPVDVLLL